MNLLAIALFSEQLINAIGTTLIHSLWQGLILVGVTGLIMISTRLRKSTVRYNLLISALFIFFLSNVITFVNVFAQSAQSITINLTATDKINLIAFISSKSLFTQAKTYLANYNETIVLIWFLIVAARCFQLFVGLNGLNYLRKNVNPISSQWDEKAKNLAQQLGIKAIVQVAESGLIRVPMVIGHLKPLILLPLGLLTALPPKEIEAILVHELAHIYRRDYLVNLLQSVIEILFFFNPAVLWLSSLIKSERENCCDDIAIHQTGSKVNYISALIACQEYRQASPEYAMAFSKKGGLKDRVSRLVHNHNQSLNGLEKSIFIFCIVTISLVVIAFANEAKFENIVKQTSKSLKTAMVVMKQELNTDYSLKKPKVLPKPVSQKLQENLQIEPDDEHIWENHEKLRQLDSVHQRLATENKNILDSLKALNNRQKNMAEHLRLARLDSLSSLSYKNRNGVYRPRTQEYTSQYKNYLPKLSLGDRVKEELIIDGIITNTQSAPSFMLSEKEMIVNGKRQPQEIYQRYREKYVPATGKNSWALYYNYDLSAKVDS